MFNNNSYKLQPIIFIWAVSISCHNQGQDGHAGHQEKERGKETTAVRNIALNDLLKPTNAFVLASIPVTATEQKKINIELNVLGNVAYDTRQMGTIAARGSGRIEKLYIKYKYQRVQKGQKVMEIYSPELATAQQNLLFLQKNDPRNTALINAAVNRLLLLGLNQQQIDQIASTEKMMYAVPVYSSYAGFAIDLTSNNAKERDMSNMAAPAQELTIKEGMYLQKGQAVFSVYNADKAWILLNLYPEQQALVRPGAPVHIVPETTPHQDLRAKIGYIEPFFRPGNKTLTARVYVDNAEARLPIGSRVRATIFVNAIDAAWLPREAVLSLGINKVVFLKETVAFRARQIYTGLQVNNLIQVLKGLSPTDSVAANAQYLVDNEAFIQIK